MHIMHIMYSTQIRYIALLLILVTGQSADLVVRFIVVTNTVLELLGIDDHGLPMN